MKQTTIYKQENGSLYKDPFTKKRVVQSRTITTPSGLTKVTEYNREYRFKSNGKLKQIISTQTHNSKTYTTNRQFIQHKEITTTPEGKKDRVKYDNRMLLPKELNPHGFEKTKYTYDSEGRVIKSKQGNRVTHYSYNSKGELSSKTDPKGRTTTYNYDSRDRLKSVTYPNGNTLHYNYDANGNIQLLTTPTPTEHSFGYNGVNKSITIKLSSNSIFS
jgi:YD repeat-containing protein